jgi:hypothetical protein
MKFLIQKTNGKLAEVSKEILREKFNILPDGQHLIEIQKSKSGSYNHPTRYKYYFDCVLGLALPVMSKKYLFVDQHGEMRNPATVEELHYCIKVEKNPVKIISNRTGQMLTVGQTTTKMSDREFIGDFLEEVLADFHECNAYGDTGAPLYEEWKEYHKTNSWKQYKEAFTKVGAM